LPARALGLATRVREHPRLPTHASPPSARSKRLVLSCQIALLLVYAMASVLALLLTTQPTSLDTKLYDAACAWRGADTGTGGSGAPAGHGGARASELSRMCKALPAISAAVSASTPALLWSVVGVAALSVVVAGAGVWYAFEIAYIEKKGIKHTRRVSRTKHTIPWAKIRVSDAPAPPKGKAARTGKWVAATATAGGGAAKDKDA
jgi:hypothetical protein